ncbi:hypothetical protein MSAN_01716600 [Mycena sanguinolenta]|uniref:Uncharacterized protein n=1 Tax=Mycena sanguinolenta TaxID=230812 RepID=A0A8H7CV91_9AGAR|nr:hypothetical protein MSAN_01716600 [Mycena sanguinolenta]
MNNGGNNDVDQPTSALYQYAVPAAVFIFAAVSITIYFRASFRRGSPSGQGFVVAVRGTHPHLAGLGGQTHVVDPRMKPPVFDAYLNLGLDGDGAGDVGRQWDCDHEQTRTDTEWAEIMPLAVANLDLDRDANGDSAAARAAKRASAASPSPPPDARPSAEVDPRPPDVIEAGWDTDITQRVLVSVIVAMPVASEFASGVGLGAGDDNRDEVHALPYLELGRVEVDVLEVPTRAAVR